MSYSIRFLNDRDFEKLPARDIESKIGVAYPETGEAFVRSSGVSIVDTFTAMHELEHLKGNDLDEHFDTENKCYYKDFGQTMQTLAPALGFIPGVGPALAIGAGVGGGMMHNQSQNKIQKSAMEQQQNMFSGFGMPSGQEATQGMSMPATSMAQGASGGGGQMGAVGGNAIKGLSGEPQFGSSGTPMDQFKLQNPFGNYSGRQ